MDEQFLEKRWMELAKRSYEQSCYTFSEFLDESQLSFFLQVMKRNQYIAFTTFGGYDESERQMIRFGSADIFGYEVPFPIAAIHIKPLIAKFSDELSHRDFLGAIMNTGIERDIVGDILVQNNECYFFCTEKMAPYLLGEIKTIKHTHISCQLVTNIPEIGRAHV